MVLTHVNDSRKKMWGIVFIACVVALAACMLAGTQAAYAVDIVRYAGNEAVDTAVENSKAAFPNGADTVVLACEDDYQDSMSATGLAGAYDAPILLTNRTYLSPQTEKEISNLKAKTVYIIGGVHAVAASIEKDLKDAGYSVKRIAGNESYDTSLLCAQEIVEKTGDTRRAIVVTSYDFQDALSVSSFAYKFKVPILIQTFGATSSERKCTEDQQEFLKNTLASNAVAVTYVPGGFGAVSYDSVEGVVDYRNVVRISGNTGYDTSNALAEYFTTSNDPFTGSVYFSKTSVGLANGTPQSKGLDALTSSSVLTGEDAALLLVDNTYSSKTMNTYLYDNSTDINRLVLFGGKAVIGDGVCDTAAKIADGHIHYTAIIGVDTWREQSGNFHLQASDLMMLMRFDEVTGATSLVSIPRDTYYDNTLGGTVLPGTKCNDGSVDNKYRCNGMTWQKANYAFHYGFFSAYDGSNYEDAVRAGSLQTCQMMSDVLGVHVDKYATLDLYQYMNLIDSLSNVSVDLPFPINGYTFYSDPTPKPGYTINQGWQTLNGWSAMIASRARVPYESLHYNGAGSSTYAGSYGNLLVNYGSYYAPEPDGVRQFLNRRTFAQLMKKGLSLPNTADVLNGFVATQLIYTNVSADEVTAWSNSLRAAGDAPIYMACGGDVAGGTHLYNKSTGAITGPYNADSQEYKDIMATGNYTPQWLIPFNSNRYKNTMEQACAEIKMSAGWGASSTTINS